jgi:nicotinamidase-related amidase
MPIIDAGHSILLVVDIQARLMPVIHDGERVVANARRLVEAAALFQVPVRFTEQNARGLGSTVADVLPDPSHTVHKMSFDATAASSFDALVPGDGDIVVVGCEAHVCVLQTVLGLLKRSRTVRVVRDAIGSRVVENREAAVQRMMAHGAEIVTTEMVIFEWLGSARHTHFREAMRLVK